MGKWNNRRWVPRRRYYDERRPSPPNYYQTKVNPQEVLENNALHWEEKFCILSGVPWHKAMAAKKYLYCHENVEKWNDLAGEDALSNAKEHFCAMIYGLPCDAPKPDPDMYIDNVDWNAKIDPELMADLDREYFNPDEAENSDGDQSSDRNDKNVGNDNNNPWEAYRHQNTVDLKEVAHSWNMWGNSQMSKNGENPWALKDNNWGNSGDKLWGWNSGPHNTGQSNNLDHHLSGNGALKDNNWGNGRDKSRDWNIGPNNTRRSNNLDRHGGNLLTRAVQNSSFDKEKGWGAARNNWDTSFNESRNARDNNVGSWNLQPGETSKDSQWRENGDDSLDSKRWLNQNNDHENNGSRRQSRGGGAFLGGGCLKREGSQQFPLRHKSWKAEGDGRGVRQFWGNGRTQSRY